MEIRRTQSQASATGPQGPARPVAPSTGRKAGAEREGDRYTGAEASTPGEVPFWLVCMSTDHMTRRQYLSASDRKAAATLEARWLSALIPEALPVVAAWQGGLAGPPRLSDWQDLSDRLAGLAGGWAAPKVVWQPAMRDDRGQYLWRLEGSLMQLRRGAPGTLAEWAGTVAHETFHHIQQELVVALYRGTPELPPPFDQLAPYYRDARNTYVSRGPACPPAVHRKQDLEVGAWAFGEAIAKGVSKNG